MLVKYEAEGRPMGPREEREVVPGNAMGVPIFSRQYRYVAAITPGADPFEFAADGIMVSQNATVTLALADDPTSTAAIPLLAGVQYDLAVAKVTVVSAGTAYALYHRKPSAP